jgi:hypothetical protein
MKRASLFLLPAALLSPPMSLAGNWGRFPILQTAFDSESL